jgi:hypothetical protein
MENKEWWQLPVRFMRVDYAPDFAQVKHMDLDALAKSRIDDWQINCEWVVGTPGFTDAGHLTTFAAEGYEIYPGFEDFDYLRVYTPIAHKHGVKVISYLNGHFYCNKFAESHLGWEQITCRGVAYGKESPLYGSGTTFCVNSPWRDWEFGLIRGAMKTGIDGVFLDGPVIFPDSCYCPHCQAKFRAKYGADIPLEDWENPLWRKFVGFREDSLADFLRDAQTVVREVKPDGVIFLNAGSWQPTGWRVARDVLKVQPYQDLNGAEAFFHYGFEHSLFESLMTGKYLRAGQNPSVVFTHYMNGLWHYMILPPKELELALVQTAACGANPWIALFNSALESRVNGNEPAKKIFGFMRENEEYYVDAESMADVAVLNSANTARFYLSQFEEFSTGGVSKEENLIVERGEKHGLDLCARKRDCEQFLRSSHMGYFEALTRAHVPFDILLDPDITSEKLSNYKTLVLPDASCLSEEAAGAIRDFVAQGGNLLATFEAGLYDEDGQPSDVLMDVLGIQAVEGLFPVTNGENYLNANEDHLGFRKGSLIERAPYVLKIKANSDCKVWEHVLNPVTGDYLPLKGISPYPGLITRNLGKGKVAYFAEGLGHFCKAGLTAPEDRLTRMLHELSGGFAVEVDAPRTVSVECYRQKTRNRVILHLVNNTVDGRPVREFLPVHDIVIRLRSSEKPTKVYTLREGLEPVTAHLEGALSITIPTLSLYEVVVVEY